MDSAHCKLASPSRSKMVEFLTTKLHEFFHNKTFLACFIFFFGIAI